VRKVAGHVVPAEFAATLEIRRVKRTTFVSQSVNKRIARDFLLLRLAAQQTSIKEQLQYGRPMCAARPQLGGRGFAGEMLAVSILHMQLTAPTCDAAFFNVAPLPTSSFRCVAVRKSRRRFATQPFP